MRRAPKFAIALCSVMAVACASQPTPAQTNGACGNLPPPFTPPIACHIEGEKTDLKLHQQENGCVEVEREPGEQGGLRIPPQIACPPSR